MGHQTGVEPIFGWLSSSVFRYLLIYATLIKVYSGILSLLFMN